MSLAYYVVLERKIDGLNTLMNGKSLARSIEALDEAACEVGVRPLSEFVSGDPEELADFVDSEGIDTGGVEMPPMEHFPAQDGLTTIRALLSHVSAQEQGVARDLRDCERILKVAEKHRVGWHLAIDI